MVLVSGAGTNLQALLDASGDPAYGATVVAVGADRDGIEGLARAERAGVPTFVAPGRDHDGREAWDRALTEAVPTHEPDLVVLAGFMKLVGPALPRRVRRPLRQHPPRAVAVVPRDARGPPTPWRTASRSPVRRCSSSTPGSTPGRSSPRRRCRSLDDDDVETLHERIKVAERQMLVDSVGRMAREGFTVTDRKVRIGQ